MQHYVAYHSTRVMGRPYKPDRTFTFLSSKPESVLRGALEGVAWVVVGTRVGRATRYTLAGAYRPSKLKRDGDSWLIAGQGEAFVSPLDVCAGHGT